ncbi:MAG: hypothetical protein RL318_2131 [Fibrobacterota bacterium]|jgi:L-asparaginase/Glu-tRNA(Gln) amidotransferase subunit D
MRIGLIVTGGTLDSVGSSDGLTVDRDGGLTEFVKSALHPHQTLDVVESPWRIDSSQLKTAQILELARLILASPSKDAWIIAAGTDTLAWLAPALWLLLGAAPFPILLVSGMRPWWAHQSDGAQNLRDCLARLDSGCPNGVRVATAGRLLVPYHLRKISHRVDDPFRNLPVQECAPRTLGTQFDAIDSSLPNLPYLTPPHFANLQAIRAPSVLWLPVHPGLEPQTILPLLNDACVRQLVLSGYSGGTLPRWLQDLRPAHTRVHLTTQQWGPLSLKEYAASSSLPADHWKVWSLCPETVTSLLALGDVMGMDGEELTSGLDTLEASLFPA